MLWFRLFFSFSGKRKIYARTASECLTLLYIPSFIMKLFPFNLLDMPYTLPQLNYSTDSLEPHIDARTMEIHHGKHHQTYINNLNGALDGNSELSGKSADELITDLSQVPEGIRNAVRNNGGGHSNHSFFWEVLSPSGGGLPTGSLHDAISSAFGSFDSFHYLLVLAYLLCLRFWSPVP